MIVPFNEKYLYIYGWSDDLIEFDGCINEELDKYQGDVTFNLDDGAVIRIHHHSSWEFEIIKQGAHEIEIIKNATLQDADEDDLILKDDNELCIIKGEVKEIWYKEYLRPRNNED